MPFVIGGGGEAGEKKQWPVPAQGLHSAVCCDVIDRGMVQDTWDNVTKMRHKLSIRWQLEEKRPDGSPFWVEKWFTASMHAASNLRAWLENWRGEAFTDEEAATFDLEKLVGQQAQLTVIHVIGTDKTKRARVKAVLPASKNQERVAIDPTYVRVENRPDKMGGAF